MPGFHTIVIINWIAVKNSNDPSDLLGKCMNTPNDHDDLALLGRNLLYSSDPPSSLIESFTVIQTIITII